MNAAGLIILIDGLATLLTKLIIAVRQDSTLTDEELKTKLAQLETRLIETQAAVAAYQPRPVD